MEEYEYMVMLTVVLNLFSPMLRLTLLQYMPYMKTMMASSG